MSARPPLACLVAGCAKVNPEDAEIVRAAKARAEVVQSALVGGDFGAVVDATHPEVVAGMGGREAMLAALAAGFEAMKAGGVELESVRVLDPSAPARDGKDAYVFVPFDLEMVAPGRRFRDRGGLVGVTADGGKTWVFVDAAPGREAIGALLPGLPDAITFPK